MTEAGADAGGAGGGAGAGAGAEGVTGGGALRLEDKWDRAADLALRRGLYGALAGGAAALLLFRASFAAGQTGGGSRPHCPPPAPPDPPARARPRPRARAVHPSRPPDPPAALRHVPAVGTAPCPPSPRAKPAGAPPRTTTLGAGRAFPGAEG